MVTTEEFLRIKHEGFVNDRDIETDAVKEAFAEIRKVYPEGSGFRFICNI